MTAWNYVGLLQSKSEMIYVAKNVCLTTIHRNTTHSRYYNGNTKICMFVHYMYVSILFPPTKAITIMFECVTTYYQTLQTWIANNATRYHNFNVCYHMRYHTFSLSLAWFGAICNALPRVTIRIVNKNVY